MSTFALWRLFHRPGLRGSAGHTSMLAIIAFAAATTIFLTVLGGVHGFIWRASADHTVACAFDFGACRPDTVAAWKRQISDPTSLAQFSTAYVALAVFACMLLVVPFVALAFHIYFGYRIIGRENIPEGGCVVCPNHIQLSDPPFAAVALSHRTPLRLMAKKELFQGNKLFAWLIAALGAFPVDREGADITAIKTALSSVKAGQKLIIFPQGTRGAAEGETKKGAAMLAVKSRAPILPMYISEGKGFRCKATVVIGKPFTPDPKTKEYGALADDILRRIYALKEQA